MSSDDTSTSLSLPKVLDKAFLLSGTRERLRCTFERQATERSRDGISPGPITVRALCRLLLFCQASRRRQTNPHLYLSEGLLTLGSGRPGRTASKVGNGSATEVR